MPIATSGHTLNVHRRKVSETSQTLPPPPGTSESTTPGATKDACTPARLTDAPASPKPYQCDVANKITAPGGTQHAREPPASDTTTTFVVPFTKVTARTGTATETNSSAIRIPVSRKKNHTHDMPRTKRSEERRVGKECRSRW